jgi:hypothetical protein
MEAMIVAEARSTREQSQRQCSSAEISATKHAQATFGDGKEHADAVGQLAGALRAAEHAHRAYVAELRQGDVEPAEDWSTWYAEYMLGLR